MFRGTPPADWGLCPHTEPLRICGHKLVADERLGGKGEKKFLLCLLQEFLETLAFCGLVVVEFPKSHVPGDGCDLPAMGKAIVVSVGSV